MDGSSGKRVSYSFVEPTLTINCAGNASSCHFSFNEADQSLSEEEAHCLKQMGALAPEVSVIITSFHGEYLDETILSIERMIARSGVPVEIILYDDASTSESSRTRLERLQAMYAANLRVYYGTQNLGAALGRTEAIKHSRGKYLLIFDDDDILLPFNLRGELDYMEAHPEVTINYSKKYLFSREKGYIGDVHGGVLSHIEAFFAPKVNINGAIIRRDTLEKEGGFLPVGGDKKCLYEDTDLIIRLELAGPVYLSPEARCLYRVHASQLTAGNHSWPMQVTRNPCERHPELYERILHGDIPDVHGEDFRLVRGLMGAAFFFNQRNRAITTPIVETALREFPEDYGSWELYFYTLAQERKFDELRKQLAVAHERFKDNPMTCFFLMNALFLGYRAAGMPIPEEVSRLQNHFIQRLTALPENVKEGFRQYNIRM